MAGGFNPLIRIKGYTRSRCSASSRPGRQDTSVAISEPSTLITDYLLAVLRRPGVAAASGVAGASGQQCASRRIVGAGAGRPWLRAVSGGTYHGFGPVIALTRRRRLWKLTTLAMGVASFFLAAGGYRGVFSAASGARLSAVGGRQAVHLSAWMLDHDAFRLRHPRIRLDAVCWCWRCWRPTGYGARRGTARISPAGF